MNSALSACLLSLLAGLCTGLGGLVTVIKRPNKRQVAFLMGLTAGVIITLSFVELVNEAWQASGYLVRRLGLAWARCSCFPLTG